MPDNFLIWFGVIPPIAAICAIASIVYLQRKGKMGKFAWTKVDTDLSAGCMAKCILAIPLIALTLKAIGLVKEHILPTIPDSSFPMYVLKIVILGAAMIVAGMIAYLIDQRILLRFALWRLLHEWAKKAESHESKSYSTAWSRRWKRFRRDFSKR